MKVTDLYDELHLTGYDGEYFDFNDDLEYDFENYEWFRYENEVQAMVTYNVKYTLITASYSGRDDETKQVYLSPYRTHVIAGSIGFEFKKNATEFYSDLFSIDNLNFLDSDCQEVSYEDEHEDFEEELEYRKNTCPDCGCALDDENYGGNGFCITCAPDH